MPDTFPLHALFVQKAHLTEVISKSFENPGLANGATQVLSTPIYQASLKNPLVREKQLWGQYINQWLRVGRLYPLLNSGIVAHFYCSRKIPVFFRDYHKSLVPGYSNGYSEVLCILIFSPIHRQISYIWINCSSRLANPVPPTPLT